MFIITIFTVAIHQPLIKWG